MIDRIRAEAAFRSYTDQYDPNDIMISHKAEHTFHVAGNCERIAKSLCMDNDLVDFAWFLGLLHDIGRFEQARRYGTFIDSVSVDHAEFGADLLFKDKLIHDFPVESLPAEQLQMLETAIRLHNKLALPEALDEPTRRVCDLIRDADKVDIFRVASELSFEQRIGSSKGLFQSGAASEAVMACVYGHRCVPRDIRKTRFEGHISHCCMAFELIYPESRRIAREQGFLDRMLAEYNADGKSLWNAAEREQLRVLRHEIETSMEREELT